MGIKEKSLEKHFSWKGKIESKVKVPLETVEDIMLAYTPGVAEACIAIKENPELSYELTARGNVVAVITDGSAVLGLGDIGPEAGIPVMEGKAALFKRFGNIDAVPVCLKTKDTEEIIRTIKILSGNYAGINLEDISAPRCFEIEEKLKTDLKMPVFHDDQHGTAIVVGAALLNALKVVNKDIKKIKAVVNGAGAAGVAITKFLIDLGVKDIIVCDINGILTKGDKSLSKVHQEIASLTNKNLLKGKLVDAIQGADLFIGVSVGNIVTKEMVQSMNKDAIVFALANPIPEIHPNLAKEAGAKVIGTGSNEFPNQINNVLVFPGIFRGALDANAYTINKEMMLAAANSIAANIAEHELNENYIIPSMNHKDLHKNVAKAVSEAAILTNVLRSKHS